MRAKKTTNQRIGKNIRAARTEADYTQEELSEIIGVTPNHLSAIERGASGPSLEIIESLCGILGVSAGLLLFGDEKPDNATQKMAQRLVQVPEKYRPQVNKVLSAMLEVFAAKEKQDETDKVE